MKSIINIINEATTGESYDATLAGELNQVEQRLQEVLQNPENPKYSSVEKALDSLASDGTWESRSADVFLSNVVNFMTALVLDWSRLPTLSKMLHSFVASPAVGDAEDRGTEFPQLIEWLRRVSKERETVGLLPADYNIANAAANAGETANQILTLANRYWNNTYKHTAEKKNIPVDEVLASRPSNEELLEAIQNSVSRALLMQIGALAGSQDIDAKHSKSALYRKDYGKLMGSFMAGIKLTSSDPVYRQALEGKHDAFYDAVMKSSGNLESLENELTVTDSDEGLAAPDKTPEELEAEKAIAQQYQSRLKMNEALDIPKETALLDSQAINSILASSHIDKLVAESLVKKYGLAVNKDIPGFENINNIDLDLFKDAFLNPVRSDSASQVYAGLSADFKDEGGSSISDTFQEPTSGHADIEAAHDAEAIKREVAAGDIKGLQLAELDDAGSIFKTLASNKAVAIAVAKYINSIKADATLSIPASVKFLGKEYPTGTPLMTVLYDIAQYRTKDNTDRINIDSLTSSLNEYIDVKTLSLLGELLFADNTAASLTTAMARFLTYETDRDVRNILVPGNIEANSSLKYRAKLQAKAGLDEFGAALVSVALLIPEIKDSVEALVKQGQVEEAIMALIQYAYSNQGALGQRPKQFLSKAAALGASQTPDIAALSKFLPSDMYAAVSDLVKAMNLLSAKFPGVSNVSGPLDVVTKLATLGRAGFKRWLDNMSAYAMNNRDILGNATYAKAAKVLQKFTTKINAVITEAVESTLAGFDDGTPEDEITVRQFFGVNRKLLGEACAILLSPLQQLDSRLVIFTQYVVCRFALLSNAARQGVRSSAVTPGAIMTVIDPVLHDFTMLLKNGQFSTDSFTKFKEQVVGAVKANNIPRLKELSKSVFNDVGIEVSSLAKANKNKTIRLIKPIEDTGEWDDFSL